jgi:hypothetical protein
MSTARPKTLTTIAILLVVIALISGTTTILNQTGLGRIRQGVFNGGTFQGNGNGNFTPGGGNFQGGGNGGGNGFQGGNGNFQTRRGTGVFNLLGILRTLGLGGQVFTYINIGIAIIGIGLCLLAAYGVWKQKRWALNLAMVLAILFVLGALPGLFLGGGRGLIANNLLGILRSALNWVRVVAALPIIVMGILPSVRDFVS